jgi:alkylated DNA repair dioxygenase AlkB
MRSDQSMPELIRLVKEAAEQRAEVPFNGAVVNVYDTPNSQIKWHDDGEVSVGPVVASFSLGRTAVMGFRRKRGGGGAEEERLSHWKCATTRW